MDGAKHETTNPNRRTKNLQLNRIFNFKKKRKKSYRRESIKLGAFKIKKYTAKEVKDRMYPSKEGFTLVNYMYSWLVVRLVGLLLNARITPNQITYLGLVPGTLSIYLIASGRYDMIVLGAVFFQISWIFDMLDGGLAKARGTTSVFGKWLDGFIDTILVIGCYFAFTVGYYNQHPDLRVFFLLSIFLGVKIFTDYIYKSFVSYFNEEHTPLTTDMHQSLIKKFPFLARIPPAIIKNPIGGCFHILLTVCALFNQLLLPLYIYTALIFLNSIKTIAYVHIRYRKR